MREHIVKYRTEFDHYGKFNEKAILEERKVVFQAQIDLVNRNLQLTDRDFKFKPLQIGFLQSLTLKDDPKFKEIQKIFSKYNAEVIAQGQKAVNGLHFKTVVMEAMLKFLRLMMLAPDATTKKVILDISYYWFLKHLNPKMQRKPKEALLKEIRQLASENHLLPKSILERELPSTKLHEELYEYKVRARTSHNEFDAPSFQLQHYHTHKVAYMHDKMSKKEENHDEIKKKKLMRVQFRKPNLDQYYLPPPEEQTQNKEENVHNSVPHVQGSLVAGQGGISIVPVENAEVNNQLELLNQMGGQPEEAQEPIPDQDQDKNRGKLDPFVKIFLLKQQQDQKLRNQNQNASIYNKQKYSNQYKQQIQREDEQFSRFLNDWAAKKTRFKTQVSRKLQSMKILNKTSNPLQVKTKRIDESFHKTKIHEAIRDGKNYIKREMPRQNIDTEMGLSCFDRRRIKTTSSTTAKPFSYILQQNKRKNQKEDYLDEIEDIKTKFAKQKIYSSLNAMQKGLMHAQEQQQLQKVTYPTTLLSNPFFVIKKKKKGKKKKK